MTRRVLDRVVDITTTHNRAVLVGMLVLTAGMVVGVSTIETSNESGFGAAVDTTVDEKERYIHERYGGRSDGESVARFPVYVHSDGGNALSKDALIASLRYQRAATGHEAVAGTLTDGGPVSVANLVAVRAAGDPDAPLNEQIAALESTESDEIAALIRTTLARSELASLLLPDSYESGTATAESHQMVFAFETDGNGPPDAAQTALFETASEYDDLEHFTVGTAATAEASTTQMENTLWLVVPLVVALVLVVAAVTYRDPVDVLVGVTGVVVSIVWMFGAVGWLGIDAGPSVVIGPVLIAGLSIDYGFHVFMRYREQRGPEDPIRPPMRRALRSVALALALVTVTAGIGFLSNVFNPVSLLRALGVAITLGVGAAFVVFLTLVPALKVTADRFLERLGRDRRARPLGAGAYLRPALESAVTLARRGAPVVLVVALVVAAGGGIAWSSLDREATSTPDGDVADWKQDLPGPLGWEESELFAHQSYVSNQFRVATTDESERVQLLVEDDVTAAGTLTAVNDGLDEGIETGVFARQRVDTVRSPVTVVRAVAARNESFAATVEAADTTGDGIPDTRLKTVYDHLYEVAPERASAVVERTDGKYRSLRVVGPPEAAEGLSSGSDRAAELTGVSDAIEAEGNGLTATVVSDATAERAAVETITDGIIRVMALGLVAVFGALVVIYRRRYDSATLGAMTAAPIAVVLGFVVTGMYLFDVPLTFLTALLVSLVVGIGVDYNIHVSDRFAQEFERGRLPLDALRVAVTGTGGALLGSMLTSVAAFVGMLVHPTPSFRNFASLVVLAVVGAFLTSLLVLPSLLYVWARYVASVNPGDGSADAVDVDAAGSD